MRQLLVALLFLIVLGGFGMGFTIMGDAQSAVHEIEGLISILIGTVALGSMAIALGVEKLIDQTAPRLAMAPPGPPPVPPPG